MKLAQLKTAVLSIAGITTEWVRSEFGDLRLKSTWQAAFDRAREFVAVAVDVATSERAMVVYEVVFSLVAIITIVLWRQVVSAAVMAYAYGRDKFAGESDWPGSREELDRLIFSGEIDYDS